MPIVGVLAVQGNFREHCVIIEGLGLTPRLVRTPADLDAISALILPGGESTAMTIILRTSGLLEPLQERIKQGLPCFGSCAGLILLAEKLAPPDERVYNFGAIAMTAARNAFGRQNQSFEVDLTVPELAPELAQYVASAPVKAVFIRAPIIVSLAPPAQPLITLARSGEIVAAVQGKNMACSFHPEMIGESRLHKFFVERAGI